MLYKVLTNESNTSYNTSTHGNSAMTRCTSGIYLLDHKIWPLNVNHFRDVLCIAKGILPYFNLHEQNYSG